MPTNIGMVTGYTQIHNHVVHHMRHACILIISLVPQRRGKEEAEREIMVKGTVLDAYHQRELKSCNRTKKHPWASKCKSGCVDGNAKEKSAQDIYLETGPASGREGGAWSSQTIHRH